jgi:hypothetical protein
MQQTCQQACLLAIKCWCITAAVIVSISLPLLLPGWAM